MNRWASRNPELYEQGYEPWDDIEFAADHLRKERRANTEANRETNRGLPRPDERYEADEEGSDD